MEIIFPNLEQLIDTLVNYVKYKVPKTLFNANTILKADTDDTPEALTVTEQTVVGRLTGGEIAAVALGIADNNVVQIDGAGSNGELALWTANGLTAIPIDISDDDIVQIDQDGVADNDFAKFTAAGLEGRSYAEVMADLSGQAGAAFSINSQKITSLSTPTGDNDAANKAYVDDAIAALTEGIVWYIPGALATGTDMTVPFVFNETATINYVYITAGTLGSASSTIVDVNKNGTTIFTTQASRPELAYDDANSWAVSAAPDVTTLEEGDLLTLDIDQIATGVADLSVFVVISGGAGGEGGGGGGAVTLLDTQTPTGTSVSFTSISNSYKKIIIDGIGRTDQAAATSTTAYIYVNNDTTDTNYRGTDFAVYGSGSYADSGANVPQLPVVFPAINSPSGSAGQLKIEITLYAGTTFNKQIFWRVIGRRDDNSVYEHFREGGIEWESTSAINRVDVVLAGGNFVSGSTFYLWGVG